MCEQLLQPGVGEPLVVGEINIAEHAAKSQVGIFDGGERRVQMLTDLSGLLTDGTPAMLGRNVEAVFFWVCRFFTVAGLGEKFFELLVPYVA